MTMTDRGMTHFIQKILKRIRLTQNMKLSSDWAAEYRYRGDDEIQQFKALIDANLCNA